MEGFKDLEYHETPYTWDNMQHGDRNTKVRLDRGLGDDTFMEGSDNTIVIHVQCTKLDHCALLITVQPFDWIEDCQRFESHSF